MTPKLEAALGYAAQGWHVFPLWWIEYTEHGKRCACGRAECSEGKHPITDEGIGLIGGFHAATTDPRVIEHWWSSYPEANIGGRTGEASNVDALDVDTKREGFDSWQQLREQYGELPETTPTLRTGSGGRHFYFTHATGRWNRSGNLPPGIDVRGEGGYVVLPPGENIDGPYGWVRPFERAQLADWPRWITDLIADTSKAVSADRQYASPYKLPHQIGDGERNITITSVAGTLRRRSFNEQEIFEAISLLNESRCSPPLTDDELGKIAKSVTSYAVPSQEEFPWTDLGNGRRLVRMHGSDLRFVYTWKRWLHWTGRRWASDLSGEIMRRAKFATEMLKAEAQAVTDKEERDALIKHANRSQSAKSLESAIKLATTEPEVLLDHERLDADPWTLNVRNGTIDLRTGQLRPHEQSDYITRMLDLDVDPEARAPRWEQVVLQTMSDSVEMTSFLQRCFGYMLTGLVSEDKFFIWWGSGANGKSTIQEALLGVLGPYAGVTDPELILERRGDAHPTGLADLFGRRVVFAQETGVGRALNETLVKQLTGGDKVKARRMREDFWQFDPTHKLVLVTNHKPHVRDNGPAFWRRVILIPFKRVFAEEEQDRFLPHTLAMEAPGILNWLIEGCLAWQREGLNPPREVLDAVKEYREEQDIFGSWLASRCEEGTEFSEETSVLHEDYTEWLRAGGWKSVPTVQSFALMLTERGYEKRRTHTGWVRAGLRLKTSGGDAQRPVQLHSQQQRRISFGQ